MSFHWRLTPGTVTSTCAACNWTIRSTERDVLVQQRAHSWQACQQRRAETTRVVEAVIPDEFCGKGHLRTAWNTRVDKAGDKRCSDCRRERRAAAKEAECRCAVTGLAPVSGSENGMLLGQRRTAQRAKRRTVLSTPTALERKEAVDS